MSPTPATRSSGKHSFIFKLLIHRTSSDIHNSDAVPDSQKSTGQSLADKASREKDTHKGGESVMDKVSHIYLAHIFPFTVC